MKWGCIILLWFLKKGVLEILVNYNRREGVDLRGIWRKELIRFGCRIKRKGRSLGWCFDC